MKERDRTTFCRICAHRKYEIINGLYCGLTNSKPRFELKCKEFKEDVIAREDWINDFKAILETEPGRYIYPVSEGRIAKYRKQLKEKFIIRRSLVDAIGTMALFPIVFALFLGGYIKGEFSADILEKNPFLAAVYGMNLLVVLALSIAGFFSYKNKKPKFTLSLTEGITIHKENITIPWSTIIINYLEIGDKMGNSDDDKLIELALKILGREKPLKFRVVDINISAKKFIYLVETYKRNYREKFLNRQKNEI